MSLQTNSGSVKMLSFNKLYHVKIWLFHRVLIEIKTKEKDQLWRDNEQCVCNGTAAWTFHFTVCWQCFALWVFCCQWSVSYCLKKNVWLTQEIFLTMWMCEVWLWRQCWELLHLEFSWNHDGDDDSCHWNLSSMSVCLICFASQKLS